MLRRSAFCQEAHSLVLNQEDRFPGRLPGLVHEMGHAVHYTRFKNSEEWDRRALERATRDPDPEVRRIAERKLR